MIITLCTYYFFFIYVGYIINFLKQLLTINYEVV